MTETPPSCNVIVSGAGETREAIQVILIPSFVRTALKKTVICILGRMQCAVGIEGFQRVTFDMR